MAAVKPSDVSDEASTEDAQDWWTTIPADEAVPRPAVAMEELRYGDVAPAPVVSDDAAESVARSDASESDRHSTFEAAGVAHPAATAMDDLRRDD